MKKGFVKAISTSLYIGYLPFMPGTWASLAGAGIYMLIRHDVRFLIAAFFVSLFLGLATAGRAEELFGKKDDGRIVIDELCGVLLVFLLIPAHNIYLILGFVLFRVFDIWKPYPIRKTEKLPGSWGIMADDLLAALYTVLTIDLLWALKIFL